MKVLITGCNGYLGARLFDYLRGHPEMQVFGTYLSGGGGAENEKSNQFLLDITQRDRVMEVIKAVNPDFIIHAAAIVHGDLADDSALLREVNVNGTKHVLDGAKDSRSKFMYISTIAALDTKNPYGKSKLDGEKLVEDSYLDFCILRPSVIIGLSPNRDPSVMFNSILDGVLKGLPVIVDSEWKFQPSWIDHVCEIITLWIRGQIMDNRPIYPIMPETKSRYEIAEDILSRFNLHATPVQNPRYQENELIGEESLKRNNLPTYSYTKVIDEIIGQIQNLKTNP